MKLICFYSILFFSVLTFSQKITERTITVNSTISTVFIDLNNVFAISLKTTKTNTIKLTAQSEGEYANYFVLTENVQNNKVDIIGRIAFIFPNNQDKLSAHKVHAITVDIEVPENLQVNLKSDIGNLEAIGNYKSLVTDLVSGNCHLKDITGDITIQTVKGNIDLTAKSGAVNAFSKTGTINQDKLTNGNSNFRLKTIKGNINIQQSK